MLTPLPSFSNMSCRPLLDSRKGSNPKSSSEAKVDAVLSLRGTLLCHEVNADAGIDGN